MNFRKPAVITAILAIITASLWYVDYSQSQSPTGNFFSSVLRGIFQEQTITPEVLKNTSMNQSNIIPMGGADQFFDGYLDVPERNSAERYSIEGTTLILTDLHSQNPLQVIQSLISQESSRYQFNVIDTNTFYLNQVPASQKTHNFLGIAINNSVLGFQYNPTEHRKVLEIIDALQKSK